MRRAEIEAREKRMAKRTDGRPDRLRAAKLPDGRSWMDLVREVARAHGLTERDVCAASKMRPAPQARGEIWWRLYTMPQAGYSFPRIAKVWGCDHTTVIYGVRAHEERLEEQRTSEKARAA